LLRYFIPSPKSFHIDEDILSPSEEIAAENPLLPPRVIANSPVVFKFPFHMPRLPRPPTPKWVS